MQDMSLALLELSNQDHGVECDYPVSCTMGEEHLVVVSTVQYNSIHYNTQITGSKY